MRKLAAYVMQKRSTVLQGRIISIPAFSILWGCSSTRAMAAAGQGQGGEETLLLWEERGIPDLLQPKGKILPQDQRGAPGESAGGTVQTQRPPETPQPLQTSQCLSIHTSAQGTTQWRVDFLGFFCFLLPLGEKKPPKQKNPRKRTHFFPVYFQWGKKKLQLQFLTRALISWKYLPLCTTKQRWKVLIFFWLLDKWKCCTMVEVIPRLQEICKYIYGWNLSGSNE